MLVGITGRKGSGKDAFAKHLIDQDFCNLKMAGVLKNMLRVLYTMAGEKDEIIERKIEGDLKEQPCEILGGATPRWAMQSLGTEWAKMIDPTHTLWSRIFENGVRPLLENGENVVCTDIRFQHEVEVVRRLGGKLVRVSRPEVSCNDPHPSELEMESLEVDETIFNVGTLKDLEKRAAYFLEGLTK